MRNAIIISVVAVTLGMLTSFAIGGTNMKITSSAFQQGGNIPSKYTCDGADTSPALQIADIPASAKSLVLIVDDPDAPTGLFTHWIAWNISAKTGAIAEGSTPQGVQGTNDFGKSGYGGPCPPPGTPPVLLQDPGARSRVGFAARVQANATGCCSERACGCTRGVDGTVLETETVNRLKR